MIDMEDAWDEMDIAGHGEMNTTDRDEHFAMDDVTEPSMPLPMPMTSSAIRIKGDYDNSPNQSFATTTTTSSTGTASTISISESTDSISTVTSPSLPYFNDSPIQEKSCFSMPTFNAQPTDYIAQMLEYMRACNSQNRPSPPFSSSNYNRQQQAHEQIDDERNTFRKRERDGQDTLNQRKQRSPVQTIARSLSQGNETSKKEGANAKQQHRMRQRSKTSAIPPKEELVSRRYEAEVKNAPREESRYTRSQLDITDASPHLETHLDFSRLQQQIGHGSLKEEGSATISLMEYLKQREGTAWSQSFQTDHADNQSSTMMRDDSDTRDNPSNRHQHQQTHPMSVIRPPYEASYTSLPPQLNISNMLGLQQAPNQARVHAFQTAFVLGMQQLGIAGQFQPYANPSAAIASIHHNPYPMSQPMWTEENDKLQQGPPSQIQSQVINGKGLGIFSEDDVVERNREWEETDRGAAILESLLHDINQHRPEEEEFSLDEFLAFVATTVESKAEEGVDSHKEQQISNEKQQEESIKQPLQIEKEGNNQESKDEIVKEPKVVEVAKKKVSRRRTISISGQLKETHLTEVTKEGKCNKNNDDQGEEMKKPEITEAVPSTTSTVESNSARKDNASTSSTKRESTKVIRNTSRRSKGIQQHLSNQNKDPIVDKEVIKLAERRRRRRESHNAVERRRRDHINERIAELASLLPESMLLDAIASSTGGGTTPHINLSLFTRRPIDILELESDTIAATSEEVQNDLEIKANALAPVHSSSETLALAQSKPNKGIILSKSVDYIKHLHEFCSILRNKNKEMQREIVDLKKHPKTIQCGPVDFSCGYKTKVID